MSEAPGPSRQDRTGTVGLPRNDLLFHIVSLPAYRRQGPYLSRHRWNGAHTGHSAQELLRYLVNLIHILTQQQGNPNKIIARCQFILIPYDSPVAVGFMDELNLFLPHAILKEFRDDNVIPARTITLPPPLRKACLPVGRGNGGI